ncbi:uncharacterized protein LOC123560450 [Mercenaria mercenaria]|uniref:uncharacterized protein LOC123560450 n=1 Tax=Mercenaria mercenaria TaxID=6596 RepID=UPI00234F4D03|nr:uncharacterized protein LOC123560450 [Mercenaria mercenaria]
MTLSECTGMVDCDNSTKACFTDELITDQLSIVYNAGCRSKNVCKASGGIARQKKMGLLACAKCCHSADDCNSNLCGIKQAHAKPIPKPANPLSCRSCNNALTLSDCTGMVVCDNSTEACFTDELVTDRLTIVYNAGCRSKSQCVSSGGTARQRKGNLYACSRCCHLTNDCNSDLCTLKQAHATIQHRPSDEMKCKRCNKAHSLSECTDIVLCTSKEECFMDQLITDHLETEYEGGCRSREVCGTVASTLVGKKKRNSLISCSRCCRTNDFCNKQLCGIPV